MIEKILICCFDFPPNTGIGGRRWAKFAKALAAQGTQVYVIKADAIPNQIESPWAKDVSHPNIHVTSLRRTSRLVQRTRKSYPGEVLERIRYQLSIRFTQIIEPGTIYDAAVGWAPKFKAVARRLIQKENISVVIATGAPFNLLYYAAQLKQEIGRFRLISDYRDPWIHAKNYGMEGLGPRRMEVEQDKESCVIDNSEYIISPAKGILDQIQKDHPMAESSKFVEIPHCFDLDDIVSFSQLPPSKPDTLRIIYGGAMYIGLETYLQDLDKSITGYYRKYGVHPPVAFTFFTPDYLDWNQKFDHQACFTFQHPIGSLIHEEISLADAVLIMVAEHNRNFFTTKFFDFLPYNKPYIFVGAKGNVSEYIRREKLGLTLHNLEDFEDLQERIRYVLMHRSNTDVLEKHSLQKRTQKLLELIAKKP